MDAYTAANPDIAGSIYAITDELNLAAEAMLDSSNPYSVDADYVKITTGSGARSGHAVRHLHLHEHHEPPARQPGCGR